MLSAIKCLRIPCCSLDKSPSTSVGIAGSASIVVVLSSELGADCSGGREVSTFDSSSMAILKQDHAHHFLASSCFALLFALIMLAGSRRVKYHMARCHLYGIHAMAVFTMAIFLI
ncbi:hypothetical protein LI328DRAFT_134640 [Trichoderma asperelloides]|nr:hypothetical protein LI328DRAFT_134640 [Trichoderma asperelloides]